MSQSKSFQRFPAPTDLPTNPVSGYGWEDGKAGDSGYLPGCRTKASIGSALEFIDQTLKVLTPSWTPVDKQPATCDEERELEGVLTNSFTTWTDAPQGQYHLWYDWNFHLIPEEPYQYLKGLGNAEFQKKSGKVKCVGKAESMECEWDTGNFAQGDRGRVIRGGYYDHSRGTADWGWPQRGQKVWLTGRWIYDCGHAADVSMDKVLSPAEQATWQDDHPFRSKPKEVDDQQRHRSELHPVKAMATLRTEGFKFPETQFAVPATQFVFFACRKGGYFDFAKLNDRDYSFLVDLPDPPSDVQPPVPEADLGQPRGSHAYTLDARLPFLVHWRFFGHDPSDGEMLKAMASAQPRIEAWNPDNEAVPKQARVTIPLTALPDSVVKYGVMVSVGWPDPNAAQARRVRKVTVTFKHVRALRDHPGGFLRLLEGPTEEWLIRTGVNGRWWTQPPVENIDPGDTIPIKLGGREWTVELFLADTDTLHISCHGNEEDPVGDVFWGDSYEQRKMRWSNGRVITWDEINDPKLSEDIINRILVSQVKSAVRRRASPFPIQNYPLGRLEWFNKPRHHEVKPTSLAGSAGGVPSLDPIPENYEGEFVLRANELEEDTDLAETWEKDNESDYELRVHLKIVPQPGLPPPA